MAREPATYDDRGENRPARFRDPFESFRSEVNSLFDSFFGRGALSRAWGDGGMGAVVPRVDVKETPKELCIEAELPGMDEKNVEVVVQNGVLTLKGEKSFEKKDEQEDYHMMERRYGSFQRSIPLPDSIDDEKIEAKFDKGVLKITAPKRPEAARQQRRIDVKRA